MILFVGNLNATVTTADLRRLFAAYGVVQKAEVITDLVTRRSRGFGFVDIEETSDALNAVQKLHHTVFMNNQIVVTDKGPRHAVRTSFAPPNPKKSK